MAMGRKPKPTHLKLVTGNPGRRPLSAVEAQAVPALPSPPPHLSDDAKVEWGRVSEELYKIGLLSGIDRASLAAYCQAYGRWATAERAIAEMGKRDLVRYAAEFGMTPSARSRIIAAPPGDQETDPAAAYLA